MENVGKKYQIIYADPPWEYKVWGEKGNGRSAASHYAVQPIEDLQALDIHGISANDSVLFMWATYPLLQEALGLGRAWGFMFKTVAFTWVKLYKHIYRPMVGMGHYTRANAESVLLFTKGRPLKRVSKDVEQVLISKAGRHSQKPPEIRERIVQLFGDLPRIELFARSRDGFFPDEEYKGWDVFGNEVNNSVSLGENGK